MILLLLSIQSFCKVCRAEHWNNKVVWEKLTGASTIREVWEPQYTGSYVCKVVVHINALQVLQIPSGRNPV